MEGSGAGRYGRLCDVNVTIVIIMCVCVCVWGVYL